MAPVVARCAGFFRKKCKYSGLTPTVGVDPSCPERSREEVVAGRMNTHAPATHVLTFAEERRNPIYQAYQILHWGFVIAPVVAGVDKFFMLLTNWTQYLWPPAANLVGGPHTFMNIVGAIEILAGVLVALKPKIGGYVVAFWLWGIIANLLLVHNFYDIALRDFDSPSARWRWRGSPASLNIVPGVRESRDGRKGRQGKPKGTPRPLRSSREADPIPAAFCQK
jgi:hypothetical protein